MQGNRRVQEAHYQSFDQFVFLQVHSEGLIVTMHHFVGASCNGREGNSYGGAVRYDPVGPSLVRNCTEEIQNAISRHGPTRRPVRPSMTIMRFTLQRRIPRYRLQSSYMVASQARRGNNSLMPCRAMAAEEHCGRN